MQGGAPDRLDPLKRSHSHGTRVVDDVRREDLTEPVQVAFVEQVSVHRQGLANDPALFHAEVGRTTFFRHFGDKQEVVFAQEQELFETIAAASETDGTAAPRSAAEAVEQLRPILLALCAQATADPEDYTRHFQLIEQHPELRARDAVKMRQIALACYQTAKGLGNDPHTLVDETRAAFGRALTLGTGAAEIPAEPPGSG